MAYQDGILICNVGKVRDNATNPYGILFLARAVFDGVRKDFFVTLRPANTTLGTVKEWVFSPKSLISALQLQGNASVAPGILDAVEEFYPANEVFANGYAGLKPDVLTNDETIFASTLPTTPPAAGTLKGENITQTLVDSLLDLSIENSIYGTTNNALGLLGTTGGSSVPSFASDPLGAIKASAFSPIQSFQDSPVQTTLIWVGVLEIGSRIVAGKPFVLPVLSKKKPLLG